MDRELVLAVLVLSVAAPVMLVAGLLSPRAVNDASASERERRLWGALVMPVLATSVIGAALGGWALLEPERAESVPAPWLVVSAAFALVWCRAIARAVRAALPRSSIGPAETVGLLRPRVRIASSLAAELDEAALAAAVAHEEAHARHHDPLRIWLAQLATDLQWPARAARARFEAWAAALELARDEDVRRTGIDGADLAAAVLGAARFQQERRRGIAALAASDAAVMRERVERLLAPLDESRTVGRSWRPTVLALIVAAVALGAAFGETFVRLIFLGQA